MSAFGIGPRAMLASVALLIGLVAPVAAQEQPSVPATPAVEGQGSVSVGAPVPAALPAEEKLSDAQLDQLAAPIALHPDSLLAQILTAATYPLEVEMAARWSKGSPNVKGKELEDAMQRQNWDPAVKALTAVPQVLAMMSDKLDWTKQLGDAYLAQPEDLTQAIQRLRQKAADAGNLKTTKEQKITRVSGPPPAEPGYAPRRDYIAIEPVEPDVVYVPVYDPVLVYGPWPYPAYAPFYWYPPGYVAVGIFAFSAPIIVGAAIWARYNWHTCRVGIHAPHYNAFNRTRLAPGVTHWSHNPVHRGNIAYSKASLQQHYGKPGINGHPVNAGKNSPPSPSQYGATTHRGLTGNINQTNSIKPNGNIKQNTNLNAGTNQLKNANTNAARSASVHNNAAVNRSVNASRGVNAGRSMPTARMMGGPAGPRMGAPAARMGAPAARAASAAKPAAAVGRR